MHYPLCGCRSTRAMIGQMVLTGTDIEYELREAMQTGAPIERELPHQGPFQAG